MKNYYRFFDDTSILVSINLDFDFRISWTNFLKTSNYKQLRKLHILTVKISHEDLVRLVDCLDDLRELSFTLKNKSQLSPKSLRLTKRDVDCFSKLTRLFVDLNDHSSKDFFDLIVDSATGLEALEIVSFRPTRLKINFNLDVYRNNPFRCLKELILNSVNISIDSQYATHLIRERKLERFYFDCDTSAMHDIVQHATYLRVNMRSSRDNPELNMEQISRPVDNFITLLNESSALSEIKLFASESILLTRSSFDFNANLALSITSFDIATIHLHSSSNQLNIVSQLKSDNKNHCFLFYFFVS